METKIDKSARRKPREAATTYDSIEAFEQAKLEIARKQLAGKDFSFLLKEKK